MIKNVILFALTVAVLAGCSSKKTEQVEEEVQPIPVRVMKLQNTTIARSLEYSADLRAYEEVFYAPAATGRIEKINVEVGDQIRKGQVLAVMDQSNLYQAQVQLKNLETEFNRARMLDETGSISKQQYDIAQTNYEVAKSNVSFLEENTKLIAPFNGVVTGKYYENGEVYTGAAVGGASKPAIISIEQINPLKAYVDMTEQYYPLVKVGTKVELRSNIYPNRVFNGTVNIVYPTLNSTSRTFTVEIKIPNDDLALRPGMYGNIEFFLGEAEAMVVPALAVLKLQGSNERYVFVNNNGKAKRIPVTLGKRFEDQLEIISDEIREGDELIIVGQGRLVDSSPISILQ